MKEKIYFFTVGTHSRRMINGTSKSFEEGVEVRAYDRAPQIEKPVIAHSLKCSLNYTK